MAPDDISRDPRVYLAEERTYLAWIRTSLALMAFGFVVARFGLFLRELESLHVGTAAAQSALSLPLGVGLVVLGVLIDILASWNHVRYIRALNQGSLMVGRPSFLAIGLAIILALAGLTIAFYLGATRNEQPAPGKIEKEHSSMKTGEAIEQALSGNAAEGNWPRPSRA
jgi:putative membrane protein